MRPPSALSLWIPVALLAFPSSGTVHAANLTLNVEAGAGWMLSTHQREAMEYGPALQAGIRPALTIDGPLAIQLAAATWWFPSDAGTGRATLLGAGLRYSPDIGRTGRLFFDADVGLGITGSLERFALDVGVGFLMPVSRWLLAGPSLRYGQMVSGSGDDSSDAKYIALGLAIGLEKPATPAPPAVAPPVAEPPPPKPAAAPTPPPDTDRDGVADGDDLCPSQAMGQHPDPRRRGCPLPDSDSDGVFDPEDGCPTLAAGPTPDPERPGCPDGDDDNDKVLNHADACRTTHHGLTPDPARPGCPSPDRDGDSIADASDACPDRPGAPHTDPKRNGCPGLVVVESGQIRILKPVYFATKKDRILPRSFPVLRAVADALRAMPELRRISIDGHTDSRGGKAFNLGLSQRRAEGVLKYLVTQGVDAARLEAHGYGDSRPVATNRIHTGRADNRRVEFVILDPSSTEPSPR